MRGIRVFRAAALFAAAFVISFQISGGVAGETGIRGFSPGRVAQERELEQRLRRVPDADHAEDHLRHLTSEPHMAGTPGSRRVAEWLRDQYRSYGFEVDLVKYSVWLPRPGEPVLELVAPEKKSLATKEEPFEWDKDTYDARSVGAVNGFSPSGDITEQVVYANYGMVDDYKKLAELGLSVEGRIVIARYGQGYRGTKARLAEEHQAAGLLIYSDPADDGYVAGDPYPRGPWRPMSGIQRGSILYTALRPFLARVAEPEQGAIELQRCACACFFLGN
jgi:N-acetylated-alpha-linked acidic dipeptidase